MRWARMNTETERSRSAQADLTHSARRLETSADQQQDSADRRTELAADRTVLAAERTYAAWVRTGLAALASGVGARALLQDVVPDWLGLLASSLLLAFAGFCFVAAVWREMMRVAPPRPDTRRVPPGLLITVNGVLLLVCIATLVGVWMH